MSKKYDYDVVIIGAGISGLVCGCYLARAGMKTLIVEKNANPGGYCTSFKRGGFYFDACAHSMGSLGEDGNITKVLRELDLDGRLNVERQDPSDIIIAPDRKIHFWNDLNRTVKEFQDGFPAESSNIESFFDFLKNCHGTDYIPLRKITFQSLLDKYFSDNKLKTVLSFPIMGNTGFPVLELSAFTAVTVYKEFLLDGGYCSVGGMQEFPDLLLNKFKEMGGEVSLASTVKEIRSKGNIVEGIVLKGDFISAKYVVSNADARETFLDMIESDAIPDDFSNVLDNLVPSLSMFILYLGIDGDFDGLPVGSSSLWFLPHYDMDDMMAKAKKGDIDNLDWFLLKVSEDRKSVLRFVNSPYMNKDYWKANKSRLIDLFIKKTEQLVPNLSKHIVFKDAATPNTLSRWTNNYMGAAYGWASIPSQSFVEGLSKRTIFSNLYLTGHWTTRFQGIPGVVYLGRDTANTIIFNWTKE